MGNTSAFTPQSNTIAVVTNASANTASSLVADVPNRYLNARVVNAGSDVVFISFTSGPNTAVIATAGSDAVEYPVLPNSVEVFSIPPGPALNINTISGGTSVPLYVTFGEGI